LSTSTDRRVLPFSEGSADQKNLLGGKGANLAEMTNIGLPVPPGFIVTTDACRDYLRVGDLPDGLMDEVHLALKELEEQMGCGSATASGRCSCRSAPGAVLDAGDDGHGPQPRGHARDRPGPDRPDR
jgi:hypothetical protein